MGLIRAGGTVLVTLLAPTGKVTLPPKLRESVPAVGVPVTA